MSEKILFPRPDDWKRARLIQRDGKYIIQSRYNKTTGMFEEENEINTDEECAELVAFNLYTDTFNASVVNQLQQRTNFKRFCEEHQPQENDDEYTDKLCC